MSTEVIVGVVCMFIGCCIGFAIGCTATTDVRDDQLVKRGLKAYNATTGVLEWTKKAEAE